MSMNASDIGSKLVQYWGKKPLKKFKTFPYKSRHLYRRTPFTMTTMRTRHHKNATTTMGVRVLLICLTFMLFSAFFAPSCCIVGAQMHEHREGEKKHDSPPRPRPPGSSGGESARGEKQQRKPPPPGGARREQPPPPVQQRQEQQRGEQKPPPPSSMREADSPQTLNSENDDGPKRPPEHQQQQRKKKMTASEYVEARKEMKPPPVVGKKKKSFMDEVASAALAPAYKFIVEFPKNSMNFAVLKCSATRQAFRTNTIKMLSKIPTGKMNVSKFGSYLGDALLLAFTIIVARVVHLFTPFAKAPPASVRTKKVGADRVNIQFHMPFAGGADKCIVFLKGNKVLCRCPEKMLECETTLSPPPKGSTWIIFEEPKWLEYKDELVVVAKSVKRDKDAKKIEKMPLKTPAARKKSVSRTAVKSDDEGEDRAPARASSRRTATKAKKTPAARARSPASPRRTRQTPAKKK